MNVPQISIPDIRDYERINAELIELLHQGCPRVRLVGAEGQRFLVSGLRGSWKALIEVEGRAGPELAAGLDAPGVTVICRGAAADGAGRGLRDGRLLVCGDVGEGLGYAQEGGVIITNRNAGNRAGLNQKSGVLVVLGRVGRLAGERQSGGLIFVDGSGLGPHAGRGHRGGRLVRLGSASDATPGELETLRGAVSGLAPWIDDAASLLAGGPSAS
ncbi:glutamate synthase [Singulisphaera sp. PoT]|uniref:GltB/FmdC/FwdC-like GXGXG domain-containing protein n=1 Tax=Singulisphaera sp. PoT TaxID=3411797 RepID=UPI003BF6098A